LEIPKGQCLPEAAILSSMSLFLSRHLKGHLVDRSAKRRLRIFEDSDPNLRQIDNACR